MQLDSLRALCLSLPAATEDIKWGNDLVFCIGHKMFCVVSFEPPFTYSIKVPGDLFEEFIQREEFIPAPYLARAKWIKVINPDALHKSEWEKLVKQSYMLIKAKLTIKVRTELGI